MKLINFHAQDGIRTGLVRDEGIEDLAASGLWLGTAPVALTDLQSLAAQTSAAQSPLIPMANLRLAPVVMAPEKILCVGLNYRDHAREVVPFEKHFTV